MNGLRALVILNLGATRSFMSIAPNNRFDDAPYELDYPLEGEIADDCPVKVSRVHRRCILDLFREIYLINLVPIPLRERKVIVLMDWLRPNGAMVDYDH